MPANMNGNKKPIRRQTSINNFRRHSLKNKVSIRTDDDQLKKEHKNDRNRIK
jgi:hypothetical protein